jgi:DNA-binding IscR family transcriptional regulator
MESRTERLLRALGNREAYAVVLALLEREQTTSGLAEVTKVGRQSIDQTLEILSQASIVSRRAGAQGAWFIVHWPETFKLFDTARLLGVAVQGSEDRSDDEIREIFARLEQAGTAAAAAKRGRPKHADT